MLLHSKFFRAQLVPCRITIIFFSVQIFFYSCFHLHLYIYFNGEGVRRAIVDQFRRESREEKNARKPKQQEIIKYDKAVSSACHIHPLFHLFTAFSRIQMGVNNIYFLLLCSVVFPDNYRPNLNYYNRCVQFSTVS